MNRMLVRTAIVLLAVAEAQMLAYEYRWPWNRSGGGGDDGTGPNQGRMLMWGYSPPGSPSADLWLHAVWCYHCGVEYSHSEDGGRTWDDPSIRLPSLYPFGNWAPVLRLSSDERPWVNKWGNHGDYLPLDLVIRKPDMEWYCNSIPVSNDWPWPISTTLSTSGPSGEPMVYLVTTLQARDNDGQSRLYFCAFDTFPVGYPNLDYSIILASVNDEWYNYEASIDYTPGDYVHITYRDTNGKIQYFTWQNPLTPDDIRAGMTPTWVGPFEVTSNSTRPAHRPSVDADGERVYCAWRGPNQNGQDIGEVWSAARKLTSPPSEWRNYINVSKTPEQESDYPQPHTGTCITWQEYVEPNRSEVFASFLGDIENVSLSPAFNNMWPQGSVKNPVPPEPFKIYCHVLWSQESVPPPVGYIHYRLHTYVPRDYVGYEYPTYINAVLGEAKASPYCLERDGFKEYWRARIDYGLSRLVYELPYLDPSRSYLLELVAFNGESVPITQRVVADGYHLARVTLQPGACDTIWAILPRSAHRGTVARLEVIRESGPFACAANAIKLYETQRIGPTDGAQGSLHQGESRVVVQPNPFHTTCVVRFPAGRHAGAAVRVYDINGCLVRNLNVLPTADATCTTTWDGTDRSGTPVPPGVYYCRVSAAQGTCVKVTKW